MTTILEDLLTQVAIYWPPGTPNEFNRIVPGDPREIKVRWNYQLADRINDQGDQYLSSGEIYHQDTDIALRGILWLSEAKATDPTGTALASIPATIPKKGTILEIQHIPDVDNCEQLYKAFI